MPTRPPYAFCPRTLPASLTPPPPTLVSGYGATFSDKKVLHKAVVPISDLDECNATYTEWGGLGVGQICAGPSDGSAHTCIGDYGAPLYLDGYLYGLAESNLKSGRYTEAAAYTEWIINTINAN